MASHDPQPSRVTQPGQGDSVSTGLLWGIRIGLMAILFLPLVVGGKFFFPFIVLKNVLFRIITEVMFFGYVALAWRAPRFRPRWHPLTVLTLAFIGVATLTSLTGRSLGASLWGNYERMGGLLLLWHLGLYFFVLVNVLRRWEDWRPVLALSIFVSLLMSLFALGQWLEIPYLLQSSGGARLTATIGNATYLAGYLLFHLFFIAYFFVRDREFPVSLFGWRYRGWVVRGFLAGVAGMDLFILYLTQTRGALLGLLVGLLFMAVAVAVLRRRKLAGDLSLGLAAVCVLLPVALYFGRQTTWVKNDPTLVRLTSISLEDVTSQSRLDTWQASWRGWTEDPIRFLVGYGLENYALVFNQHFPPRIFKDPGSQIWFDRAHNIIFDTGVTTGLIGLLTYLAIYAGVAWALWRAYRQTNDVVGLVVLLAALVAYFVQNLFVFDTLESYLLFFLTVAAVVARTAPAPRAVPPVFGTVMAYTPNQLGGLIGLAGVLVLSVYVLNIRTLQANHAIYRAIYPALPTSTQTPLVEQRKLFRRAIDWSPIGRFEARQQYAIFALGLFKGDRRDQGQAKDLMQEALTELRKSVVEDPHDIRNHLYYASVANRSNIALPDGPRDAIDVLEPAIHLSPTRPQVYFELGQAYLIAGQTEQGLALHEQALALSPHVLESHIDTAAVYLVERRPAEALARLARAKEQLKRSTLPADQYLRLVRAAERTEQFATVVELYEMLVADNPPRAEYYAKLATAYAKIGDQAKAVAAARQALELDPTIQDDFDAFVKKLKSP